MSETYELSGRSKDQVKTAVVSHYNGLGTGLYLYEDQPNYSFHHNGRDVQVVSENVDVPFVLLVPDRCQDDHHTLIMSTNNCNSKNGEDVLTSAINTAYSLDDGMQARGPIIVPILRGDLSPYWQQLSRECLEHGYRGTNKRFDECVIDSIDKAKRILDRQYNISCEDKLFLAGYSTSGVFAQRFAFLHPELVDGVSIGGASSSIPVVDDSLGYPAGTKDYEHYTGRKFSDASRDFRSIDFKYYTGQFEFDIPSFEKYRLHEDGSPALMHDMYDHMPYSCPTDIADACKERYGSDPWERSENMILNLKRQGCKMEHEVYPGFAHNALDAEYMNHAAKVYEKTGELKTELGSVPLTDRQKFDLECAKMFPAKSINSDGMAYRLITKSYMDATRQYAYSHVGLNGRGQEMDYIFENEDSYEYSQFLRDYEALSRFAAKTGMDTPTNDYQKQKQKQMSL